jgi:DNA polymerase family A
VTLLYLDFETRSSLDLKKVGLHNYAREAEILCTGYAYGNAPVTVAGPSPLDLTGCTVVAHNAAFEREMIRARWGLDLPWDRFIDTAALAARMSLPRKLEALALALGVGQKDMAGHRTMLKLSRPRGGWDEEEFWEEEDKPADFAALREYCRQDVEVMRACYRKLLPLSRQEQALYALTGRMNDTGVPVDLGAIPQARTLLKAAGAAGEAEFKALTGGPGVKSYARAATALGMPDMRKPTVRDALRNGGLDDRQRRALELFQRLARSSPAKLQALLWRTSSDGRLRGAMVYCGAERTGRWSSVGVQLQNLPRGLGAGTERAFDALSADVLDVVYDDVVGTTADMLRGFFVGPFISGDFSQIEARTLAWLAGQEDLLQVFRSKGDPYCMMASRIYGRPVAKEDKDERFMGKQAVLGCFSADTPVLTHLGWKSIVEVQSQDMVWDGEAWVSHAGVVCRGKKDVLRWQGIGVTPDHLLWTGERWASVSQVVHASTGFLPSVLASASSAWRATWRGPEGECRPSESHVHATGPTCTTWTRTTFDGVRVLAATHAPRLLLTSLRRSTGGTQTSWPMTGTARGFSIASPFAWAGATTRAVNTSSTTVDEELQSTDLGAKTAGLFSSIWSGLQGGMTRSWKWIGSTWTRATARGTFGSLLAAKTWRTAVQSLPSNDGLPIWSESCETFDIAFAGPRNRYTVLTAAGPVVAHNCGYGLGPDKFQRMLDEVYDVQVDAAFAYRVINTYRESNRSVVAFWYALERAVGRAVKLHAPVIECGRLTTGVCEIYGDTYLYIQLPSGRRLYYAQPEIDGEGLHYFGRNIYAGGKWMRVGTYGGKLAENVTQAVARDVMAEAMLRLDEAGYRILFTVHDEVVAEDNGLPEAFKARMVCPPSWADGLPIDVDITQSKRYRK